MDGLNIDRKESLFLLTELPDGCPAIILQHPYAEKATQVHVVAVFSNTEAGHELAEVVCDLKNNSVSPYIETLVNAQDKTARAVEEAAINILNRAGRAEPTQKGDAE